MNNKLLLTLALTASTLVYAQVGMNTTDPKATFDIVAKNTRGTDTSVDGIIIPRVDRQKAQSMINIPRSTLIYVNNISTGTQSGIASNISDVGFYHFDGLVWVRLDNPLGKDQDNNLYNTDGTLEGSRIVTQGTNTLSFVSNAVNGFSVDGNTFSVNTLTDRVGIGTIAPAARFHVAGGESQFTNNDSKWALGPEGTSPNTLMSIIDRTNHIRRMILKENGDVHLGGNLGTTGGNAVVNVVSGNVGVGTTDPKAKVDIVGSILGIKASTGSGSWDNIWFDVSNPFGPSINASGAETGLQFKVGTNAVGTYGDGGQVLTTVATMLPNGRVGIGTTAPNSSAALEVSSNNKGFLPPRLTTTQRDALNPKPAGLMIYNVTTNCLEFWNSSSWVSTCAVTAPPAGAVTTLTCGSATNSGTLAAGGSASGVSSSIPYTGGNGGSHGGQTVNSTGVTGLTATLAAGSFANGAGSVSYTITGTPSGAGTANFAINIGGQACTLSRTVTAAIIASLNCAGAANTGNLVSGSPASGVSSAISYTGGNGGSYAAQNAASTGVTGLTATLAAGNFTNGNGKLTYTITGTPSASGTASFAINIGGQSCTLTRTVNSSVGSITALNCAGTTLNGVLRNTVTASGVTITVPYTGGNGGTYSPQSISSTGVTGLTASLTAGSFANGNGNLTYTISGTPLGEGTASFNISIGGRTCAVNVTVGAALAGDIICTTEGVWAVPNTTNKYYRCIRIGGVLYTYIFECPQGSGFNPVTKLCEVGYTGS